MDWFRKRTPGILLNTATENYGDREALVFGNQRSNHNALKTETDRINKSLIAIGVESSERVALWMTNRPEWLYLMLAIASFKIPRQMIFVDEFPMTSSGKIRKVELRAQARGILNTLDI